ncbi:MAG: hypothetical protein QUS33_03165 [Dehalococcoidia bacterium]|nr:hypothetical protein [Dehalococcoidia bacterium]
MNSVSEAAAKLGLTERHVRFLLKRGKLKGKKLGHDWVVFSLDYVRKRKPKTRGAKTASSGPVGRKPEEVWTEGSF